MRILHINTLDIGGAAKSCIRLHEGLLGQQIESKILLRNRTNHSIPNTFEYDRLVVNRPVAEKLLRKGRRIFYELKMVSSIEKSNREFKLQQELIRSRPKGLEMMTFPDTPFDIMQSPLYKEADLINLHWVGDFLDFSSFFEKNQKPVVWTLHDEAPFLGGEHYEEKWLGMDENGSPNQRIYSGLEKKVYQRNLEKKEKSLERVKDLHIVAPSRWLKEKSAQSRLFGRFSQQQIPYGYPVDIFRPLDKNFCRDIFDIPQDKKVLLFVADSLTNHRKGYQYLQQALKLLLEKHRGELLLLAVGDGKTELAADSVIEVGRIVDERLMAMAYSAADIFVVPSLVDNLPNTMIESLLCGTPVIGFQVGGIQEVIHQNKNGLLVPEINTRQLADTISLAFKEHGNFNRMEIAAAAKLNYELSIQAKSYINLYNRILKN